VKAIVYKIMVKKRQLSAVLTADTKKMMNHGKMRSNMTPWIMILLMEHKNNGKNENI